MSAFVVLLPLLAIEALAIYFVWTTDAKIARRLREAHAAAWEAMGHPQSLFVAPSWQASIQMYGFVWARRHRQLGDTELDRLCGVLRTLSMAGVGLLLLIHFAARDVPPMMWRFE